MTFEFDIISQLDAKTLKPAQYHAIAREIVRSGIPNSSEIRIAFLGSYSMDFLNPYLLVEAARLGMQLSTWYGPFGQIEQVLLDDTTDLWQFGPDLLHIALCAEDQDPNAFLRHYSSTNVPLAETLESSTKRLLGSATLARQHCNCQILISNFAAPFDQVPMGLFDANLKNSCATAVANANHALAAATQALAGVFVWDYCGLVRSRGAQDWTDRRLLQIARQPIATANLPATAQHICRAVAALLRPSRKCLVIDLDNTIWGGAAGDDGMAGIALGDDHPGNAYKSFQRAILALKDQGIILAISSKNDEAIIKDIIDHHPDMLLRWSDFVAARINWSNKSQSLRELSKEMNIGLDSLVFFDDNPVERAEVRLNAPEVAVIEVPESASDYAAALFASGFFDNPSLSREDQQRSSLYQRESARKRLRSDCTSMEEFLISLEMKVEIGSADRSTINRITQLVTKTNQFNLTTNRHNEVTLQSMADSDDWCVRWTRLFDRFGDSGLIGVTITQYVDTIARIDSFVMSCRVMNRMVEHAMLCDILQIAVKKGVSEVVAEYVPTDRNTAISGFYNDFGFEPEANNPGSGVLYRTDIDRLIETIHWPDSIALID